MGYEIFFFCTMSIVTGMRMTWSKSTRITTANEHMFPPTPLKYKNYRTDHRMSALRDYNSLFALYVWRQTQFNLWVINQYFCQFVLSKSSNKNTKKDHTQTDVLKKWWNWLLWSLGKSKNSQKLVQQSEFTTSFDKNIWTESGLRNLQ